MANKILLNSTRVGINSLKAGTVLNPGDDYTSVQAAGGVLVDAADPVYAAAAVKAQTAALRGANESECTAIMMASGVSAVTTDLAGTAASQGASLVGVQDSAGLFDAATVEAALAEAKAPTVWKRELTVGHADLTAAVNGLAQAFDLDDALPANARVLGASIALATPLTGGGATGVLADIGTAGDADAIVDAADVLAAAVDGQASTLPAGIAPNKLFAAAGAQLVLTLTPDGAHTLLALTAGELTACVLFTILP